MILGIGASIGICASCAILLIMFSGMMMLALSHNGTKKSWSKVKEFYPYFSYPFIIKIFFVGLKGKIPIIVVVLSFAINILFLIMLCAMIWNIIVPNLIVSYILRIAVGICFVFIILRALIFTSIKVKL